MKISPNDLAKNGYIVIDIIKHEELIPFIQAYLKKRTKYSIFYYLSNLILFTLILLQFISGYNLANYNLFDRLAYFSYGLAIAFLLLPLHEYLHVLAYKWQGAKNTSYDANLKKFYFMALADKFVANKKEFEVVALTPFITITIVLIILMLLIANSNWNLTVLGVLFAHTAMCSGDFGLLSYVEFNKNKQIVTFDDVENKLLCFYGMKNEETHFL